MATLEKRLTQLEGAKAAADFSAMTGEQLDAHLANLEAGSPDWFDALMASIWRKGSKLPISTTRYIMCGAPRRT